jgi:hypothetical protein
VPHPGTHREKCIRESRQNMYTEDFYSIGSKELREFDTLSLPIVTVLGGSKLRLRFRAPPRRPNLFHLLPRQARCAGRFCRWEPEI